MCSSGNGFEIVTPFVHHRLDVSGKIVILEIARLPYLHFWRRWMAPVIGGGTLIQLERQR